jgi:Dolichyl-phosphate-mannose-protein mannosyltransferase
MRDAEEHSRRATSVHGFRHSGVLLFILLLSMAVVRFTVISQSVAVHNDERHYAVDGFWIKATVPASVVFHNLLYNHMSPHALYNPRTGDIEYHGEVTRGFPSKDSDLGPYPRAGHPALYMLFLGAAYAPLPATWLLQDDHYVQVARAVNILFDSAMLFLLFAFLQRLTNNRMACLLIALIATLPYSFVNGALAFLDPLGTFCAVLCLWYYTNYAKNGHSFRDWCILGIFLGLSVLTKQSNIIVLPMLVCSIILFTHHIKARHLVLSTSWIIAAMLSTLILFSNPVAFYKEFHRETVRIWSVKSEPTVMAAPPTNKLGLKINEAISNFTLPFRPKENYHFGTIRHKGHPYVRNNFIVRAYELTTPLAAIIFYFCCAVLVARRRFRTWPLISCVLIVIAINPLGNVLRRLYILLPFATILIALGMMEVHGLVARMWNILKSKRNPA